MVERSDPVAYKKVTNNKIPYLKSRATDLAGHMDKAEIMIYRYEGK